jgi:predicted amidohydrolase
MALGAMAADTVRVAAVQCPSTMGKTEANLRNITNLVRMAAAQGAKIVVLPECAVQGYLDPITWSSWSKMPDDGNPVQRVAEPVPGPATRTLSHLADELNIYLCAGLIEVESNTFFNAQVLIAPDGAIIAHHRKKTLWTPGDSNWCTPGKLPVQVVQTEFGNLGLMICIEFQTLPPLLAKREADIVLYSVGWYGPNEKNWFGEQFPAKSVVPYGFDVVAANWTSPTAQQSWPGRGHSCVITREGKVLAMSEAVSGNAIVLADLEIRKRILIRDAPSVRLTRDSMDDMPVKPGPASNSNFGDGTIGVGIGIDKTNGNSTPIPIPTPTPMTQSLTQSLHN